MTRIGVVTEQGSETRVAATPATVKQLVGLGYEVAVETGAGAKSSFPDDAYAAEGASIVDRAEAFRSGILLKVNPPAPDEIALLEPGTTLIGLLSPALRPDLLEALSARGVTALALDAVPRISRAQSMDVLSSMANISGYRAVVELSTSIDWAREMRGTASMARAVTPRAASASSSSGLNAGASRPTIVAPGSSPAISASVGAFTLSTSPLASASAPSTIVAPASRYASSANDDARPAPASTTTSYPRAINCFTVAGVAATLVSGGCSVTTPMRVMRLSFFVEAVPSKRPSDDAAPSGCGDVAVSPEGPGCGDDAACRHHCRAQNFLHVKVTFRYAE